ncbi:MAG: HDOD domain-containing protein [Desulfobacterales bacterium]|nr:HDOD domain-containing protein [Desulfobacterales bacterium]
MGGTDSNHDGIDLDTISIKDLIAKTGNHPEGEVRSDPEDFKVFVNSILQKMKGQDAFLSFSRHISNVNQILTMKYSSAGDIADVILRDMALTQKVLKVVNSSFYRQFSKKGISTISEAMIILGTDEVRGIAAGLKVYEMMTDLANSDVLKEKTLKGLHRSIMARQIVTERKTSTTDTLQIASMIYELGEYLVALFDPETYIQVEITMENRNMSRAEAAKTVMGLSYTDLGRIVALKLNMPKDIVQTMQPVTRFKPNGSDLTVQEEQRYLCAYIQELCEISGDEEEVVDACAAVADKYRGLVKMDIKKAVHLISTSREKMEKQAEILDVDPATGKSITKAASGVKSKKELDKGMSHLKQALNRKLSIHEIFTKMVETMDNSFYFTQTIISIKKKQTNTMEPRYVRGAVRPREITPALAFKIEPGADLFNASIAREADIIVRNIKKEASKKKVPQWYLDKASKLTKAKGFAIFPVFVDNIILAMIYVDWNDKAPDLNQKTIEYLRVFRELMVKTFVLHSSKGKAGIPR